MPGATAKYAVPYPLPADPVADGDDRIKALAERVDYLLGEAGATTITPPAVSTKHTKVVAFSRTYKTPPKVLISLGEQGLIATYGAGSVSIWVDDITTTGFTLGIHATNTAQRSVSWNARPNATDVTP